MALVVFGIAMSLPPADDEGRLCDLRVVNKPRVLTDDKAGWAEWRFQLENYLSILSSPMLEELLAASELDRPVTSSDTDVAARSRRLYAVLASLTAGRANLIVRNGRALRNGYETWRQLVLEYEPRSDSRHLALLMAATRADGLEGRDGQDFLDGLMRWEQLVADYEATSGSAFDPQLRRAILLAKAPSAIATHLQVNASAFTTYPAMRAAVEGYVRSRQIWSPQASGEQPVPMEIGAVADTCLACGKPGHRKADCRFRDAVCHRCGRKGHTQATCRGGEPSKGSGGGGGRGEAKPYVKGRGKGASSKGAGKSAGKGAASSGCFVCGKHGHRAAQCTQRKEGHSVNAAVDEEGAAPASVSAVLPDRATSYTGEELAIGTIEEEYETDWVLACEPVLGVAPAPHFAASALPREDPVMLLVDSGAGRTVLTPQAFPGVPVKEDPDGVCLGWMSGEVIRQHGVQHASVQLPSGRSTCLTGTVADVVKNALSVARATEAGMSFVFSPEGGWMSRRPPQRPDDAESFVKKAGLYYLPVTNRSVQTDGVLAAPVLDGEVGTAALNDTEMAGTSSGMNDMIDGLGQTTAEPQDGFHVFVRKDVRSERFRGPRRDDPCIRSQIFRRVTLDDRTREVLRDEQFGGHEARDHQWQTLLPGGPRDTETRFFYRDAEGQSEPLLELPRRAMGAQSLPVPDSPSAEEVRVHELTHTPYQSWCEFCVAGRARGPNHRRVPAVEPDLLEFDYTFWSHAGYERVSADDAAVVSLTGVHRATGLAFASVVEKKGAWDFAVAAASAWALRLERHVLILRGDGEPALQSLLAEVARSLRHHGRAVEVQATPRASHQSIGAAEKMHDTLAGYVRTLAAAVQTKTGTAVVPKSRLFPWLLRHAATIVSRYHVRREGTTAHLAAFGREASDLLVPWGEVVLWKVETDLPRSKALPRWARGVWVGTSENQNTSIVLTERGFESARCVSRLPEKDAWSASWLTKAAGLPWSRHAGAKSVRGVLPTVRSEVVVTVPPEAASGPLPERPLAAEPVSRVVSFAVPAAVPPTAPQATTHPPAAPAASAPTPAPAAGQFSGSAPPAAARVSRGRSRSISADAATGSASSVATAGGPPRTRSPDQATGASSSSGLALHTTRPRDDEAALVPSSSSAARPPGEGSTGSPSKKPRVDEAAVTVNGLWNSEWEGEPDAPRRWNVLEGDGSRAQVAQSLQLLADSGPRETCVASALDMAHLFGARARHRQEEIDKLTRMGRTFLFCCRMLLTSRACSRICGWIRSPSPG